MGCGLAYAARTVARNFSTSALRWLLSVERPCGHEDVTGGGAGFAGTAIHIADVARDLGGALRGFADVARDLLRGGALLLDRGCDRRGDVGDNSRIPPPTHGACGVSEKTRMAEIAPSLAVFRIAARVLRAKDGP